MASAIPASRFVKLPTVFKVIISDIKKAARILTRLTPDDIKADQWKHLCKEKLYSDTSLNDNPISSAQDILRKNIYYLVKNTTNVTMIVIQLTQRTIINLDQNETLLSQTVPNLIALEMYIVLITTMESHLFERMLSVLEQFENSKVANLIQPGVGIESVDDVVNPSPLRVVRIKSSSPVQLPNADLTQSWPCPHCTFINSVGDTNVCELCNKTREPLLSNTTESSGDEMDYWNCAFCTLLNPTERTVCTACDKRMGDEFSVADDDSD